MGREHFCEFAWFALKDSTVPSGRISILDQTSHFVAG
jgi:hypothetical protein